MAMGGHCLLDCVTHSVVLKSSCLMRRISSLYSDEWTLRPWIYHPLCCSEIELPDEKSLIIVQRWLDTTFLTVPPTLLFWNRVAWWEESHCVMAIGGHCLLDCVTHSVVLKSSCLMRRVSLCYGDWWTLPSWLCHSLCCSEIELPNAKDLIVVQRWVDTTFLDCATHSVVLKSSCLMRRVSLSYGDWWTLPSWLCHSLCCSEIELPWWEESHCVMAIGGHCLLDCVTHSVVLKSSCLMRKVSLCYGDWWTLPSWLCHSLCWSEIELPDEKSLIVLRRLVDTAFLTVSLTLLFWNRVP